MFVRATNDSIPGSFNPPPYAIQLAGIGGGGVLDQILGLVANAADEIPSWSYYPTLRDAYLRKFWKSEPILAGSIYAMVSRVATLKFEFEGKRRNMKKYYNELSGTCSNGAGFSNIFAQTVLALLTQDNGAFWYLDGGGRPDRPLRGRVTDVRFLDQALCWRSIDPEYPVIYLNPFTSTYHRLHRSRVVSMSSMMQTDELARGIGFCAVSRVLMSAQIMRDIRQYKREKVGGKPSRGLLLFNGINIKQLAGAMEGNAQAAENLGYLKFKGIDALAQINSEIKAELLDLASLPDNFSEVDDTNLYVNAVALGLGTDTREIWSATVTGATKGDASTSDMKQRGKGIGDLKRIILRAINWHVLGRQSGVEMVFDDTDIEEKKAQAEINKVVTDTYAVQVSSGAITPDEMRAMSIADKILSASVLANLKAPENYDSESPVTDEDEAEEATAIPGAPGLPQQQPMQDQQDGEDGNGNPDEDAETPTNSGNSPDETTDEDENTPKPKRKAKNSDRGVSIPLDPITGKDIDWAVDMLGTIL